MRRAAARGPVGRRRRRAPARSAEPSSERAEDGEVPAVLVEIAALRRLDAHREPVEAAIAHDPAEGAEPEAPLADVLVPVDPAPETALRVVQMERDDPFGPDGGVERRHRGVVSGGGAEVVAGGERMLRVDAEPEPVAVASVGAEPAELLEAPADLRPLPRRVLERDRGGESATRAEDLAERARRRAEPGLVARAAVGARVRDEVRDA